MAKIVEPAKPRRVECGSCAATIEYMPEEVEHHSDADNMSWSRVKCPRGRCPGYGYPGRKT